MDNRVSAGEAEEVAVMVNQVHLTDGGGQAVAETKRVPQSENDSVTSESSEEEEEDQGAGEGYDKQNSLKKSSGSEKSNLKKLKPLGNVKLKSYCNGFVLICHVQV